MARRRPMEEAGSPVLISRVKLKNWRNFRDVEANLFDVTYLIGANATGKSNFLDAFRFLRDLTKLKGGGLQSAIAERHGLRKVRCLHARADPEVLLEIDLSDSAGDPLPAWRYKLGLKSEGHGANRTVISTESVVRFANGEAHLVLERPDHYDRDDRERLTQTSLENPQTNKDFRDIAAHFSDIVYFHLVPQLLKFGGDIGGWRPENDPFGQGFLERLGSVSEKTRTSRLKRIKSALERVVPQFEDLKFVRDEIGRPHLEANYKHYRPRGGWQREDQFSDGTLRLIALFWLLLESDELLLLEEPELSLNEEIVRQLPEIIGSARRSTKKRRGQIILSTHSSVLLENKGIDGRGVLRLERGNEGSRVVAPSEDELQLMDDGFSPAEVFFPKVHERVARNVALV